MYITGLDGQARRMYTYSEASGFAFWNMVTFIGAGIMAVGVLMLVWNIYYSFKNAPRDISQDPWDARGLEWATHTPIPVYNFAITPDVTDATEEAFWDAKKNGVNLFKEKLEDIHMPSNDGGPFVLAVFFFIGGFCLIFSMFIPAIICLFGILGCLVYRSFQIDDGYHIHVDEIEEIEAKYKQGGAK
jgi:cytochrome aa3-600 menaquinol oxidase subunit I